MNSANIADWLRSYRSVLIDLVAAEKRKATALERIATAMEQQPTGFTITPTPKGGDRD